MQLGLQWEIHGTLKVAFGDSHLNYQGCLQSHISCMAAENNRKREWEWRLQHSKVDQMKLLLGSPSTQWEWKFGKGLISKVSEG